VAARRVTGPDGHEWRYLVRWRTTSARAEKAVGEIADALSRGYDVKVKDAELESMAEPSGLRDRDS
jgi:hypothetical protein